MANYILLERIELNNSATSVTFSNIPQSGYTDLKIVISARTTRGTTSDWVVISFNGSTSSFANNNWLLGNGTTAIAGTGTVSVDQRDVGTTDAASNTSNTFSNAEIYIPNYLSSNYKPFSSDAVMENNALLAYQQLTAGMWSNTSAINSITLASGSGSNFVQYSTFSIYGIAATGTTPSTPKAYGGDSVYSDGTYWYHIFTSTNTFRPTQALTCNYLVVAGGGGGGGAPYDGAGGGGAGGLRSTVTATGGGGSVESPISVLADTSYTITVGAGGAGGIGWNGTKTAGSQGGNSTFSTITSTGGGYGNVIPGGGGGSTGGSGGSGGGAAAGSGSSATGTGGSGTANQGYAGGAITPGASLYWGAGGGGGGAGAVGSNGYTASSSPSSYGGNGGAGVAVAITGSSVTYAGGGGGSTGYGTQGTGGSSIGGAGTNSSKYGNAGKFATGSGGGGCGYQGYPAIGGNGGSGIVVVRYPV